MGIIKTTYYVHGTTTDNERGLVTGWAHGELSEIGKRQCLELGKLVKGRKHDVVFCSDLKRAMDSTKLIFGSRLQIIRDKRLRECNYGDLTRAESGKVDLMAAQHIEKPFPKGESYMDVEARMREFLKWLSGQAFGDVAIVAHKAPQLALDVLLKGRTWKQAIEEDWRLKEPKEWQPGWVYVLSRENNF